GESDVLDFLSPLSAACLLDPNNLLCTGEFGEAVSEEDIQTLSADLPVTVMTAACALDPDNPLCAGDFARGDYYGDGVVYSKCAEDASWPTVISTYGDAADLLSYLVSAGPSLAPEALPPSCQDILTKAGSAFETGLAGVLSDVIFSGASNSCIFQSSYLRSWFDPSPLEGKLGLHPRKLTLGCLGGEPIAEYRSRADRKAGI
ncbi:MAG: hypothetical protein P8Y37_06200, partial [Anaerolineales bacterium]